jgi:hypothetical protein
MIQEFAEAWEQNKHKLEEKYGEVHPQSYSEIVGDVIELLSENVDTRPNPDPQRIHVIDDGDYQGTQIYVIGEDGYQPSRYFYVRVHYGSCTGCDTLKSIHGSMRPGKEAPNEEQQAGYMRLALHIFQSLKQMDSTRKKTKI